MVVQMRVPVVLVTMTIMVVEAYKSQRGMVPFDAAITSYQKPHLRNFFLEQPPFLHKMFDQRAPPDMPLRDPTIDHHHHHAIRDQSFKEQTVYPSGFPSFRHQPFKQNTVRTTTSLRNRLLFGDPALRNQALRDERPMFRDNPFEVQSAPLGSSKEIFEGQASTYRNQAPFKEQLSNAETPLINLLRGQSSSNEQGSFQKETAFAKSPPFSDTVDFYRDDSYSKPIDSYGRQKDTRPLTSSYGESPITMEYGNQAHGLSAAMQTISSSEHPFPLNAERLVTTPPPPITTRQPDSRMSSASPSAAVTKIDSSEAHERKLGRTSTLELAIPTSTGVYNTLADGSSSKFSDVVPTAPSISVSANQSSVVGHILTSLTTESSLPAITTETPIAPLFVDNTAAPIHFHATKHGAVVTPPFSTRNELRSNVHAFNYLLAEAPRNGFAVVDRNLKYLLPEAARNNEKANTRSPVLSYILPEEHRSELKSNIQDSFVNYGPPEGLKHGWPMQQQFSQPDTLSGYVPLPLNGKVKLILPTIPAASAIPWPTEIKREVPILPAKSFMAPDTMISNNLPLGFNLPLDFMANIPNSLTPSIPNSISGSITGGISTGIPSSMTAGMPASIPALNLGQSLHRLEQLRQSQEARDSWYPAGPQLQLGGFGGINYTLQRSNPVARLMEFGIAKTDLILPKLSRPYDAGAFAKISNKHLQVHLPASGNIIKRWKFVGTRL